MQDGNAEQVQDVLARGASLSARDEHHNLALHWAAFYGHHHIALILLAAGADVFVQNADGWTPLHIAAFRNNEPVARLLLAAGADPLAKNKHGKMPVALAREYSMSTLLQVPLRSWNIFPDLHL